MTTETLRYAVILEKRIDKLNEISRQIDSIDDSFKDGVAVEKGALETQVNALRSLAAEMYEEFKHL